MRYRYFQAGQLRFYPEECGTLFSKIDGAAVDYRSRGQGTSPRFYRSNDKKSVLKVDKKGKDYYCVLFKSTDNINNYYFDDVNYSEESVEARAAAGESVVTAFRFIVLESETIERVIYEDVKTPRPHEISTIFQSKFENPGIVKFIPCIKASSLEKLPKFIKLEWEYEVVDDRLDGGLPFQLIETVHGTLKANGRRGRLNVRKEDSNFVIRLDAEEDIIHLIPTGASKTRAHFTDDSGIRRICDLSSLTMRQRIGIDDDQIRDHETVFDKLLDFYRKSEDYFPMLRD